MWAVALIACQRDIKRCPAAHDQKPQCDLPVSEQGDGDQRAGKKDDQLAASVSAAGDIQREFGDAAVTFGLAA